MQAYDEDMIREMKRTEVEDEVRKQVDVLMREELDLLKIVSFTSLHHNIFYESRNFLFNRT